MNNTLDIYTDGGCHGNPGVGAWACVLISKEQTLELSGGDSATTNNRMELMAAIKALEKVLETEWKDFQINMFCDSQYVKNGINDWIKKWKLNGWKTSAKKDVLNKELWGRLDELASKLSINWQWVKGHAGVQYNERCDFLCQKEMQKLEGKSL